MEDPTENQSHLKMNDLTEMVKSSAIQKPNGWGSRHSLTLLGFLGYVLLYGMRSVLSLAIVAMVAHRVIPHVEDTAPDSSLKTLSGDILPTSIEGEDLQLENSTGSYFLQHVGGLELEDPATEYPLVVVKFQWNERSQGLVLGAIYWGSLVAKIPGGLLAQRFGGKWCLGLAMAGAAIMTLLVPLVAAWGWQAVVAVRAIQGLCDGLCSPAMHTILAKWAPPNERSKLGTFIYAGGQLGTAILMISSGYMIEAKFLGGWPSPFFIIGSCGLVWAVCWFILSSESPEMSKRISVEEMVFIQKSIGSQPAKAKLSVPWRSILTSMPVWAIIVANTTDAWGFYTFLTELPTYMKTVQHFNIKTNSWLSAAPYLISWGFSVALTQVADHLIAKKKFPIVVIRKACETIGHLGSAVTLVAASFAGFSRELTVTLVIIGIAVNGATYGGYGVNHVDIAPNHAGVLMGVTSTIANVCGIAAPYVAGIFINEQPTAENWQIVFFITAGIYMVDVVFYLIFASGEVQPWNEPKD